MDMEAKWSIILPDILFKIVQTIDYYEDLNSFAGVCMSWKLAAAESVEASPSEFPYLLLSEKPGEDNHVRDLFLLSGNPTIRKVILPEIRNRCFLSSKGWLLTFETDDGYPNLIHPLSRRQINLPKLDTFPDFESENNRMVDFIKKAVLSSSDPSSEDFIVIVIWGGKGRLGFCRPGDVAWTAAQDWMGLAFCDIIYNCRYVFALTKTAKIYVCRVHDDSNPTRLIRFSTCPPGFIPWKKTLYITASPFDDLSYLIVSREGPYDIYKTGEFDVDDPNPIYQTNFFRVFQVSLRNSHAWTKLENLGGDRALFLGYNSSFSVKTDQINGCIKPDCIYFTDDARERYGLTHEGGGQDMGIYHMRDGTIEPHFNLWKSRSLLTPPTWVFDAVSDEETDDEEEEKEVDDDPSH